MSRHGKGQDSKRIPSNILCEKDKFTYLRGSLKSIYDSKYPPQPVIIHHHPHTTFVPHLSSHLLILFVSPIPPQTWSHTRILHRSNNSIRTLLGNFLAIFSTCGFGRCLIMPNFLDDAEADCFVVIVVED